ncbi:MAG: hypothetical protein JW850_20270 [Thermoflexales bacterium]|nr:hypothetical protein [Thermoflexales bacterium]
MRDGVTWVCWQCKRPVDKCTCDFECTWCAAEGQPARLAYPILLCDEHARQFAGQDDGGALAGGV